MKDSVKIISWAVVFVLGATLIVFGAGIWDVIERQFKQVEASRDVKVNGPTGPPYVKGPTGPPPE